MPFNYPKSNLEWLWKNTFFLSLHGSHAYGTNTLTSDCDYKGIAIPPASFFHGFSDRFEQAEFHHQTDGMDMVVYDIRKFFKLAYDCNPSIIEVLFSEPSEHVTTSDIAKELLSHREMFVSKNAKHRFTGFAVSQLKKLMRTKEKPPERVNEVRAELIAKYGYDTKDGMHVVRLLRMAEEILSGKGVLVKRPDAQELLDIRNGAWPLDDLIKWGTNKLDELDKLYLSSNAIPSHPDVDALNKLCIRLVEASFEV